MQQWDPSMYGPLGGAGMGGGSAGYPMGLNPAQQMGLGYTQAAGLTNPFQAQAGGILAQLAQQGAYPTVSGGAGGYPTVSPIDTQQMQMAVQQAQALSGGPIGQSPATQAGMDAWRQLVQPQVLQGLALTGNLGGGATQEALSLGATAAATPLIQQEIANRAALVPELGQLGLGVGGQSLTAQQANQQAALANAGLGLQGQIANQNAALAARQLQQGAAGSLGSLGTTLQGQLLGAGGQAAQIGGAGFGQQLGAAQQLAGLGQQQGQAYSGALGTGLQAAGMPYDVQAQQAQAAYNDYLRLQSLAEALNIGSVNPIFGAISPGQRTVSTQSGGGMFGS